MLVSEAFPPRAERLPMHRLLERPPTLLLEMQEEADSWLEKESQDEAMLAGEKDEASYKESSKEMLNMLAAIMSVGVGML
ncbi:hypothetical protein ACHAXM_011712 [Skeletonema potamos]|jgi:hypothetical protein